MQKMKKFSFLSLLIFLVLSCAQLNVKAAPTVSGQAIVDYTKQQLGIRYYYGGSSPSTGFDCSGLAMYVYNHFGVSLPHNAKMQYNDGKGSYVSKSNLLPGDLVFFNTNQYLGHVGIYIGNGQFIHAPNSNSKVKIESLNTSYYNNCYEGAKRFFNYSDGSGSSNGWVLSNGNWYYYDNNGNKMTGWAQLKWSGGTNWFYFDNSGVMQKGWRYLSWNNGANEDWFYFDDNGVMSKGWKHLSWNNGANEDWFYFDDNGSMLKGWQYLSWNNGANQNWFYFNENGTMLKNTTVDGYTLDDNGVCTNR